MINENGTYDFATKTDNLSQFAKVDKEIKVYQRFSEMIYFTSNTNFTPTFHFTLHT